MNTNHSPLPWHLGMKPGPIVYGPSGEQVASLHVAMVPVEENMANAQYIVQSCNAFPALVEALEGLIENAPPPDRNIRKSYSYRIHLEAARAALALARGEEKGESK